MLAPNLGIVGSCSYWASAFSSLRTASLPASHLLPQSLHRAYNILSENNSTLLREVDELVCTEVDTKFHNHVSVEILSLLFGSLHPCFYQAACKDFSYEHWPQSQVHIPRDQGNIYYMGAFWGGSVAEVH